MEPVLVKFKINLFTKTVRW